VITVSSGVIKKGKVQLVGKTGKASVVDDLPRARVIAQTNGVATIEITCACGQQITLECRVQA